jgi:hypothetical protein
LAEAVAVRTASPWAIALGEAQQDATGGRAVEVALKAPDRPAETVTLALRGTGDSARAALVTQLLDHLRRNLKGTK